MTTTPERFVGYLIGNERGEFLVQVSGDPQSVGRLRWTLMPGFAQVFATRAEAERIIAVWRRRDQEWCVCRLWDRAAQWLVDWDWDNEGEDPPSPARPSGMVK